MKSLSFGGGVSVCLATFNGENRIERLLESVSGQLRSCDELVVVDDCSDDSTLRLVNSFFDRVDEPPHRVSIYKNSVRLGVVGNFSRAISLATNRYICFCDQDDVWCEERLEDFLVHFQQGASLVRFDARVVNDDLEVISPSIYEALGCSDKVLPNLIRNSFVGCCMGFDRCAVIEAEPLPRTVVWHDWYIGLVHAVFGKVVTIRKANLLYVRHSSNASPTAQSSTFTIAQKIWMRVNMALALLIVVIRKFV